MTHGSFSSGLVYDDMNIKRKAFKNKLKWYKRNQKNNLWKYVKYVCTDVKFILVNFGNTPINQNFYKVTHTIDDLHSKNKIANMFISKFKVIY